MGLVSLFLAFGFFMLCLLFYVDAFRLDVFRPFRKKRTSHIPDPLKYTENTSQRESPHRVSTVTSHPSLLKRSFKSDQQPTRLMTIEQPKAEIPSYTASILPNSFFERERSPKPSTPTGFTYSPTPKSELNYKTLPRPKESETPNPNCEGSNQKSQRKPKQTDNKSKPREQKPKPKRENNGQTLPPPSSDDFYPTVTPSFDTLPEPKETPPEPPHSNESKPTNERRQKKKPYNRKRENRHKPKAEEE